MDTIPILYEDNHLLVVVKPPDLLSQGDRTGDRDLLTIMKEYIRQTYQKPGNVYLGLVHRLDRPVGGVMVFGKTSKGAARLSKQIRDGGFQRRYLAVVEGYLEPISGSLRGYLIKDGKKNLVRVARADERGAQEAVLDYRVVDMNQSRSLVRIWLGTGRSHQIRVQMAAIGHPLYGDRRYGARTNQRHQGQIALWAECISFTHPTTKEQLEFVQGPPEGKPWSAFRSRL
ncbi:MAG TPA: RNA pseudouridine synthase [Firmicutes bacterium]|nr:RNA pseudouridine synthase [Bacillota bacterium]